ncbi:MAG: Unknown protein [uncultured Sulfurovum sp.]|uniref:Transglycosylase SLT domain-containing protein n=1 Tax=uncultured Sulfurovum sp. TaxID=269237 RepID=A0A6S6SMU8_9BACT|nr:MAG: Unknown protein [uncultured Sulfurovum sp.]
MKLIFTLLLLNFLTEVSYAKAFLEEHFADEILRVSAKYSLEPSMLFTLASIESDFEPLAIAVETSPSSAKTLTALRSDKIRVVYGGKTFHSGLSIVSIYPDNLETASYIAGLLEEMGFTFDVGLMQINTCNFSLKEAKDMFNPEKNLEKAAKHLSGCVKRYKNKVHEVECYNRGAGNLNRMLRKKKYYYPYYKRYKKHFTSYFGK